MFLVVVDMFYAAAVQFNDVVLLVNEQRVAFAFVMSFLLKFICKKCVLEVVFATLFYYNIQQIAD